MKRAISWLVLGVFAVAASGCSQVSHEVINHRGEVYYSAPPLGTPPERLRHFEVEKVHLRLTPTIMLYPADLDDALAEADADGKPVYNLRIEYRHRWYDYGFFGAGMFVRQLLFDTFPFTVSGDVVENR